MAESLVNMELLPDDVLITVLQFLDVEDVLACRLVCKRLCGLALDQYVWRHRSLADDHPRAGAVLLLAPCLKMLTVTGRVPTLAATTTGCAVESLELRSRDADPFSPAEYSLAVLKQEALGRLRRLKVAGMDRGVSTGPDVLARTIASCSGLESLEVLGWLPELSRPIVRGPSAPSLTRFHCLANERAASFVYSILASHAPTLEEVSTGTDFPFQETVTAKFLAKLPRLRSLRCENPIGGLEAVAASPTLCEVSFELYPEDLDQFNILQQFLHRAGHLRSVHLSNCAEGLFTDVLFAEVVEALLAGPSRHLERLALQGFKEVRPLLLALPLLRSLHHLDLDAEPDEDVLKGITPATAPALTLLELGQLPVGQCPHAWMHGPAVQAMLRQNPSLHILLRLNTFSIMCDPLDCGSCGLACHQEVRWGWEEERKVSIGIFSHGPAQCPAPDDHALAFDWQRGDDGKAMVTWIHM
ncbi:uncharacterized protein LOC113203046 [Frankliniella occidentalis]|uniref:Uncharacterized protein LOC113203046 n=1 Tax=Frankliniella occidentalis TaxID=133901 RepID=A0A9C6XB89_FRAOC|nr:uncharacterized protein LOC113203046 [Frankliniella occidentalis]